MGSHHSANMINDEWLTPPHILKALGEFDLDPCAPVVRPWPMAKTHYTKVDDGLQKQWFGRVWCNPPYGREIGAWVKKASETMGGGGSNVDTGKNRHSIFPRIHLSETKCGNSVYQRSIEVRRFKELCTFPKYGGNFQIA